MQQHMCPEAADMWDRQHLKACKTALPNSHCSSCTATAPVVWPPALASSRQAASRKSKGPGEGAAGRLNRISPPPSSMLSSCPQASKP